MAKVLYKQGTKATYLSLLTKDPTALYFCTDTRELFKGGDLYSDGLRIVDNYESLPAFQSAADGILYFCADTGNGYTLSLSRNAWIPVFYGPDNKTIGVNDAGMLSVKSIPIATVEGLETRLQQIEARPVVISSDEITVEEDGSLTVVAIAQSKVIGLEDRLAQLEQLERPEDLATKDEVRTISNLVDYEIFSKPESTLVNRLDKEIRVLCAADTQWEKQAVGANGDSNSYYIGFKAYAPSDDVVSFKEDLAEIISDQTMYYFEDNDFAGIDEYGRKYSIVWLPVARYDEATATWSYYGEMSTTSKYIGFDYAVEWYNADQVKVDADLIRINLANEDCYLGLTPSYVIESQSAIAALEECYTWSDM